MIVRLLKGYSDVTPLSSFNQFSSSHFPSVQVQTVCSSTLGTTYSLMTLLLPLMKYSFSSTLEAA